MRNKKAWIKIAEVFICVLIVGSLFTVSLIGKDNQKSDLSSQIEIVQESLLHRVQLNDSLREEIIELGSIPKESNEAGFPQELNKTLEQINLNILKCEYKICAVGENCVLNDEPKRREVFVKSVIISSTKQTFKPRSLNIFCWEK